jgi:hypothetical protein
VERLVSINRGFCTIVAVREIFMKKQILLMFALSTIFLGCNPKMNSQPYSAQTQTFDAHHELVAAGGDFYSYQFVDNGCDTGRHEFEDHAELCRALLDDAFNHWCAWRERHEKFQQDCN